jgi:hypothetical protein
MRLGLGGKYKPDPTQESLTWHLFPAGPATLESRNITTVNVARVPDRDSN